MCISKSNRGFTILEVIISLVIVAISITVFINLLGNSTMLRSKVNEYDERYFAAIEKTEQAFLGLLNDSKIQNNDKTVLQGTIEGKDFNWHIEEIKDDYFKESNEDVYIYTVYVDGIEISSVVSK